VKRLAVALGLLALISCSSTHVTLLSKRELPKDLYPQGKGKSAQKREQRVTIYLLENDQLVAVSRVGRSKMPEPELVVRALLSGPTRSETSNHITTSIPASVELTSVSVSNGVADVDLNTAFKTPVQADFIKRVAQIVYTLDELQDIDSVRFFVEGRRLLVLDQNGHERTDAVSRGSYVDLAPKSALGAPVSEGPLRLDMPGEEEAANP
jgi:spore germination protein GerM